VTDDRLIIAIGRLDRALTRLESVAAQEREPAADSGDLAQRHERLRERTREAVDALDRLIGDN
jgi:hypothetical protein